MNERELLESLVDAIDDIDDGCSYCIAGFVEKANEALEKDGVAYRYRKLDEDKEHHVEVIVA